MAFDDNSGLKINYIYRRVREQPENLEQIKKYLIELLEIAKVLDKV